MKRTLPTVAHYEQPLIKYTKYSVTISPFADITIVADNNDGSRSDAIPHNCIFPIALITQGKLTKQTYFAIIPDGDLFIKHLNALSTNVGDIQMLFFAHKIQILIFSDDLNLLCIYEHRVHMAHNVNMHNFQGKKASTSTDSDEKYIYATKILRYDCLSTFVIRGEATKNNHIVHLSIEQPMLPLVDPQQHNISDSTESMKLQMMVLNKTRLKPYKKLVFNFSDDTELCSCDTFMYQSSIQVNVKSLLCALQKKINMITSVKNGVLQITSHDRDSHYTETDYLDVITDDNVIWDDTALFKVGYVELMAMLAKKCRMETIKLAQHSTSNLKGDCTLLGIMDIQENIRLV